MSNQSLALRLLRRLNDVPRTLWGTATHVEKWSYPFFEKVGATAGGAAGGSASELGNDLCGC
jgi:hypothetical protein